MSLKENELLDRVLRDFRQSVPMADNMIAEVLRPAFFKRRSYSHETEWRAVVYQDPRPEAGLDMQIDVNALIEQIIVAPKPPTFSSSRSVHQGADRCTKPAGSRARRSSTSGGGPPPRGR